MLVCACLFACVRDMYGLQSACVRFLIHTMDDTHTHLLHTAQAKRNSGSGYGSPSKWVSGALEGMVSSSPSGKVSVQQVG